MLRLDKLFSVMIPEKSSKYSLHVYCMDGIYVFNGDYYSKVISYYRSYMKALESSVIIEELS